MTSQSAIAILFLAPFAVFCLYTLVHVIRVLSK